MTIDVSVDISAPPGTPVLHCREVRKHYRQGGEQVDVLTGVNLSIAAGEKLAIVGASGSGKSTLLNMLGGLDDPSSGEVWIQGAAVAPMSESARARWRNQHLGFVYQFHHLLPEFSALENVAMPLLIGQAPPAVARERARALLAAVGLAARTSHKPAALSGGERQRVAIARALATGPGCVLMDEPTGNLDPATAGTVLELLLRLNNESHTSFVIVTHDRQVAARMDRIVSLEGGRLNAVDGAP